MQKKISIIIASYQEPESIRTSIKSVLGQKFSRDDYELILVAHGWKWNEGTVSRAKPARFKDFPLTLLADVPKDDKNSYAACKVRNAGLAKCTGKLVFLMHDNVALHTDTYLRRLWIDSEQGRRAVSTAKRVETTAKDGGIVATIEVAGFYAHQDAIPLDYFRKVGGFDESYDGDQGYDDKDLECKLYQAGCVINHDGNLFSVKTNRRAMFPDQYHSDSGNRNNAFWQNKWHGVDHNHPGHGTF